MARTKFGDAFNKARTNKQKEFDYEGDATHKAGKYSTATASDKAKNTPRGTSGSGMRRDPNGGETMAQRHDRLVAQERRLAASRPKTETTTPPKSEASAPKRPSASEILARGRKAEGDSKANERGGFRNFVNEAKQLPGRAVEAGLRAAGAPSHVSIFAGTLLGNRQKITEDDLDETTKTQLRHAARRATSKGRQGDILYKDYDTKLDLGSLDPKQAGAQIVGRTAKGNTTQAGGRYRLRDKYDFSNEGRDPNVDRYAKMGTLERAGTVLRETIDDIRRKGIKSAIKKAPSRLGNAYIGRDTRDLDVTVAKGGLLPKKFAKGGTIDGCAQRGKTKGRFV